ncbi:MAG: sigma-70 family RNA polymerase sigma factor [Synergistaceae bacterium]|jgi:RNA polymerase sigma factor (sigma-70 family)|nr:sigma-70 family RNA polymerase sigma factor [Synergistaceae bacterium]
MRESEERSREITTFLPAVIQEARKLSRGDAFTAEDLVQEGLIAALGAYGAYDPDRGSAEGFLRVCARNRMISYLRRTPRELPADDEALDSASAYHAEVPLEQIEMRDALLGLMEALSPFERSVLRAYLVCGGVSKAAVALRCDRKKADNALSRIRGKARRQCRPTEKGIIRV